MPLTVTVPAGSVYNVSSNVISGLTKVIGAVMIFPTGTSNLLYYQFLENPSKPTSTNILAGGLDVAADVQNPALYVGDGVVYPVPWQKTPNAATECIVMNVVNNSGNQLTASAIVWLAQ